HCSGGRWRPSSGIVAAGRLRPCRRVDCHRESACGRDGSARNERLRRNDQWRSYGVSQRAAERNAGGRRSCAGGRSGGGGGWCFGGKVSPGRSGRQGGNQRDYGVIGQKK